MAWIKYTVKTLIDAEEAVCAVLMDLGYESFEIEDGRAFEEAENGGLFGDVLPDIDTDDGTASISFYTEDDADSEEVVRTVSERLELLRESCDIGEGSVSVSRTDSGEWMDKWKEHFHTFTIDDIRIVPTWEADSAGEDGPELTIYMEPGCAFGTGAHESTMLAVKAIRKYIKPGDSVFDVGCGTGILGIIAVKSGAERVFATDIDENVLPAVRENIERNNVPESLIRTVIGNVAEDESILDAAGRGGYDIVCANIIAEILEVVTPNAARLLKDGGIYITSGILTEREHIVEKAGTDAGLQLIETVRMGDWSSLVFRKGTR